MSTENDNNDGLTWKTGIAREIAIAILVRMVGRDDRIVWPDEIEARDRAQMGGVWQRLVDHGIVKRTSGSRRSKLKSARGRTIFSYRLANEALAKTFLQRNGCPNPDRNGNPSLNL